MDIKKYEGSLSLENFVEGLLTARVENKTLGEVWEDCVSCDHCPHRDACRDLTEYVFATKDTDLYCDQVIEILLGNLKIEEVE